LSELVLKQNTYDEIEDHNRKVFPIIDQFFERSQLHESLTSLAIQGLYIRDLDMITLLQRVPSLQILSIHDPACPISKAFIKSLHGWRKSNLPCSLVPKLRELSLKVGSEGFDPLSFVDTIASRWLPDEFSATELGLVCLRSVELHLRGKVDAKPYEKLKEFDKAGLRVVVKCKGVDGYIV
jgi:hypothetical protein